MAVSNVNAIFPCNIEKVWERVTPSLTTHGEVI